MPTAPNTDTMSTDELREYEQAHGRLTPTQARSRFQHRARQMQARALAQAEAHAAVCGCRDASQHVERGLLTCDR